MDKSTFIFLVWAVKRSECIGSLRILERCCENVQSWGKCYLNLKCRRRKNSLWAHIGLKYPVGLNLQLPAQVKVPLGFYSSHFNLDSSLWIIVYLSDLSLLSESLREESVLSYIFYSFLSALSNSLAFSWWKTSGRIVCAVCVLFCSLKPVPKKYWESLVCICFFLSSLQDHPHTSFPFPASRAPCLFMAWIFLSF